MMTVESFEENLKQNNEKCDVLIQEILSTAGDFKLHELLYRYLLHLTCWRSYQNMTEKIRLLTELHLWTGLPYQQV